MLRNKIISIVALAVIGVASPGVAFARGGGGGHGGGGFHGGGFHAGGFGSFHGGGFRGRGFGVFGPYAYVTIPTFMAVTTTAAAIWSPGESRHATAGAAVASTFVTDSLD
jgi:hypothetical protein